MDTDDFHVPAEFAIFHGGPLRPLFQRFGLLVPRFASWSISIIPIYTLLWLPLLALSLWEGRAWSGADVPFLRDYETQARFLVTLPLLLWAEIHADRVLIPTFETFVTRGVVRAADRGRFDRILIGAMRVNRSVAIFVLLVVFVSLAGHLLWQEQVAVPATTWYGEPTASGLHLHAAGWWYVWVAVPIFQFILYRWYLRLVLWWFLLLRLSRLDLHLVPTHPDGAGGIAFMGERIYALFPFLLAQGFMVAGLFYNRIIYADRELVQMWPELVEFTIFLAILVLGPLTAFSWSMIRAKRRGRDEYSRLASRYVDEFERKWIQGGAPPTEPLAGSPDIQSLADLANGSAVVEKMRITPFGKPAVLKVVLLFAVPVSPLLLTVIPVRELLLSLAKMLV